MIYFPIWVITIGELSDIVRQSGISGHLEEEVLEAVFRDIFRIDLHILPIPNPKMLLGRVMLVSDTQHIDDFIAKNSLNDKKEKLLGLRSYIFENCKELSFQCSYMATFRKATRLVVVYDYHEYGNEGEDITKRRIDTINLLITGFLVGLSAGMTGTYVPTFPQISSNILFNMVTQGLIWGCIGTGGIYTANRIIKSITESNRTVSKRKRRDNLGWELIINDEISLQTIENYFRRGYNEIRPPRESYVSEVEESEGRYSGRKSIYRLTVEESYIRSSRKSKYSLNLLSKLQNNPNSPLFGVILASTMPSNVIGSVVLDMKIGDERRILHRINSFQHDPFGQEPTNQMKDYKDMVHLITSKYLSPLPL